MPSTAQLRSEAMQQMQKTKHVRRGRVWDGVPNDGAKAAGDRYAINKVFLLVGREARPGRWEAFENSRTLLHRLDSIGKSKELSVRRASFDGTPLTSIQTFALNLYLFQSKGLTYFRRTVPFGYSRTVLCDLLSRIGIPTHNVIKHQIVHQVRDGQGRKGGARKDRGLSLPRGQRRKCARGNENLGSPGGEAKA